MERCRRCLNNLHSDLNLGRDASAQREFTAALNLLGHLRECGWKTGGQQREGREKERERERGGGEERERKKQREQREAIDGQHGGEAAVKENAHRGQ